MLQFIVTNILMISLGTMLYLVARTLPRIGEEDAGERQNTLLDRWVTSEIPHKIDAAVSTYSGKLFRKLKVALMRFDNYLTERLKKMNTEVNGNDKKIDFSELGTAAVAKEEAHKKSLAEEEKIGNNTVSEA